MVLATGATAWRELTVPGRELAGVHQAMEYLPLSNRVCAGDLEASPLSAAGKHVVIVGAAATPGRTAWARPSGRVPRP
ncbi:hypothetical protein GCM10011428_59040 [Streptomyces violaceus]